MPPRDPDLALRRTVVRLARLHVDDVAAVLDDLNAQDRRTVEALLRQYTMGAQVPPSTQMDGAPGYDTSRLSPWLAERLAAENPVGELKMHTREVLRAHAAKLYPLPMSKDRVARSGQRAFGRIVSMLVPARQSP